MEKHEAEKLLVHHGKSEAEGSYDDRVVGSEDGKDITIGMIRSALSAPATETATTSEPAPASEPTPEPAPEPTPEPTIEPTQEN